MNVPNTLSMTTEKGMTVNSKFNHHNSLLNLNDSHSFSHSQLHNRLLSPSINPTHTQSQVFSPSRRNKLLMSGERQSDLGWGENKYNFTTSSSGVGFGFDSSALPNNKDEEEDDIRNWDEDRVLRWLINCGFEGLVDIFKKHHIDGRILLDIDEKFAVETLEIHNALVRRKLVRRAELLKKRVLER